MNEDIHTTGTAEDFNPPPVPPAKPEKTSAPIPAIETVAVMAMAFLADFLLYTTLGGTGAGLVLLAGLAGVTGLLGRPRGPGQTALFFFIVLCSAMMVWRHWWLLEVTGWTSVFILAAKKKVPERRIPEAIIASIGTLFTAPLKVFNHIANIARCFRSPKEKKYKKDFPVNVVFIPLGILIVFLVIFCNANPVFARLIMDALEKIHDFFTNIFEYISIERTVIWLLWLTLFSALTAPLLRHTLSDRLLEADDTLSTKTQPTLAKDGEMTALVTLLTVNLLFLVYNGLDSIYLYLRATLPEGITWSAYTHAGCGWLTLGLFLSTVILGCIFRGPLNFCAGARKLKLLSYIWAGQNLFLAFGSMRRLQMYIDFSGLTHLRITGIYGSLLVAVGLIIMARKVQKNRGAIWMLRSYALAFYTTVAILAITPNDFWCASYNTKRIKAGKPRALRPVVLKELSAESLPPLLPLLEGGSWYETEAKTSVIQKGIAALISDHLAKIDARNTDWRKWQASEAWAVRRLKPIRSKLDEICPSDQRQQALKTLKTDYDLRRHYSRW